MGGGCTPICVLRIGGGGGGCSLPIDGCDGRFPAGSPATGGCGGRFPAGSPAIDGCDAGRSFRIDGCDGRVPGDPLPIAGCDAGRSFRIDGCDGRVPGGPLPTAGCDAARCRGCGPSCVASGSCSGDAGTSALAVAGPPRPSATGGEDCASGDSSAIFPLSIKVRTTYSSTKNAPCGARVPTPRAAPETASSRRRPGGSPHAFRACCPEPGTGRWRVQM